MSFVAQNYRTYFNHINVVLAITIDDGYNSIKLAIYIDVGDCDE
jgi:hypothetical protein